MSYFQGTWGALQSSLWHLRQKVHATSACGAPQDAAYRWTTIQMPQMSAAIYTRGQIATPVSVSLYCFSNHVFNWQIVSAWAKANVVAPAPAMATPTAVPCSLVLCGVAPMEKCWQASTTRPTMEMQPTAMIPKPWIKVVWWLHPRLPMIPTATCKRVSWPIKDKQQGIRSSIFFWNNIHKISQSFTQSFLALSLLRRARHDSFKCCLTLNFACRVQKYGSLVASF